ncbi:hypothetical protein OROMI_013981 [Orobanche minor]
MIANKLTKQLCTKTFPHFYEIVDIVDTSRGETNSVGIKTENASGWEILKRDHKVYASLHQAITKSNVPVKDCIENAFSASSTDRFPSESIVNTLSPRDRLIRQASYWSSRGQSDPSVPETLVYKLKAGIWVITEICIQPFQDSMWNLLEHNIKEVAKEVLGESKGNGPSSKDTSWWNEEVKQAIKTKHQSRTFFQPDSPIYSSKSVRFRFGHPRPLSESGIELLNLPLYEPADDMFQWTYTSPEFPMMQFVCFVRALGRSLFPAFDMEVLEPYGFKKLVLKHDLEKLSGLLESSSVEDILHSPHVEEEVWGRIGLLEDLLRGFQQ